jgi:bacterioferritin
MPQFVHDVQEIRQRAIRKIEDGPVTQSYGLDKDQTVEILNEALATEIVCVLRYMHHYFMSTGVHGKSVSDEFKEHADAEREHADAIAERIQQLGGKPDFSPQSLLQRSVTQYVEGETLADMIREDLIAERIVIEVYTEMIRFFGDKDPTTRVMVEGILKDEEEHANELADLLYIVDPRTGETEGQDPGTRPLEMHQQESRGQQRPRQATPAGGFRGGSVPRQDEAGPGARTAGQAIAGQVPPAHEPGTHGRPPRKGADEMYDEAGDIGAGEETGSTRAVRVTNPSRKRKRVA